MKENQKRPISFSAMHRKPSSVIDTLYMAIIIFMRSHLKYCIYFDLRLQWKELRKQKKFDGIGGGAGETDEKNKYHIPHLRYIS